MSTFLTDVAKYLYNTSDGALKDVIVVFPNRRARLFFNKYLSELSDNPIWAPRYFTISDFITEISSYRLADPLSLVFKLFETYTEVTGSKETFDNFYYYCEMILADFDDIDKNLVDAGQLYTNLGDLKSVEDYFDYLTDHQKEIVERFWQTIARTRQSNEQKSFSSMWDAMKKIYYTFNDALTRENIAYEGKIYRDAINRMESAAKLPFIDKKLAFVGFNALNKAEEKVFSWYKAAGNSQFFWDYDMRYINSDIHEAGYFLRKYLQNYPSPPGFNTRVNSASDTSIKVISVPSNISQAKVINECINDLEHSGSEDPEQMAIVLADEKLLLPVVNSIPENIQHVNISMGYPVIDTPAYSFIEALVELHLNRRDKAGNSTVYYHKDFFAIISHPFMKDVRNTKEVIACIEQIKSKNPVYIDPLLVETDDDLYNIVFKAPAETKDFGKYLSDSIRQLVLMHYPGNANDKEQQWQMEVLQGIYKVVLRFDQQIRDTKLSFTFPILIRLLKKVLRAVSVPFSGEPLSGMQIMGILETRTLDFENIILLSLNEGKFPKSGNVPSMIPYALREGFQLPTVQHQDAIYAYYFYRLLHRAKNVYLVYNTRSEGIQKGEPSRYIYQLQYDSPCQIEELNYGYRIHPLTKRELSVKKTPDVMDSLAKYLRPEGKSYLSPSALNTFLNCSLRFYFRYIEGMKEAEEIEENIEANVFGSIVHRAMELIYSGFKNNIVNPVDIDKIKKDRELIKRTMDQAFNEEYFGNDPAEKVTYIGRNLIIRKVIERYITGLLAMDKNYAPFRIVALEEYYTREVEIKVTGKRLALGGIIDRIDEKEGMLRIADYKTGKKDLTFRDINDLFNAEPTKRNGAVLQIFTYSWMVIPVFSQHKILPSLLFVRDIYKPDFDFRLYRYENRKKLVVSDFNEYLNEFEDRLKIAVSDLFNTDSNFIQTGDTDYCLNCPYNNICMRNS